ncbi:MAG: 50S ribosomal protein L18 [Nanoarchaeota archaeon]|nr:50S ribosomal protein L18 [Nanoarchaeota archaeon]MBU1269146.1 50S ribosomal protein L18 [Nanoarchaeota archaeon]MBU1605108.1 50S ribosomal protein L18 [Nanoarchaeota archaeon]MBU2442789.1 50S ribosomal protein L18 [Nanoarchaeota archaeon]
MSKKIKFEYRRKREGKTNYKRRLALLKSRKDRLVIRKTNNYLIAQIVRYEPDGDKVLVSANSKELQKLGWKNSCKNIPASYLTGLILGKKASEKKIKEAIVDLGLQTPIKGSRLYSLIKGVVDSGMSVPASEDVFPPKERLTGSHISDKISKEFETLKNKLAK